MLRDIQKAASVCGLTLSRNDAWRYDDDYPHISKFSYAIGENDEESEDLRTMGSINGYRIVQDWTVEADAQLWDEADALARDAVCYVEALIREVRACNLAFDGSWDLTMAQRITIVRHVEAQEGIDLATLTRSAVA